MPFGYGGPSRLRGHACCAWYRIIYPFAESLSLPWGWGLCFTTISSIRKAARSPKSGKEGCPGSGPPSWSCLGGRGSGSSAGDLQGPVLPHLRLPVEASPGSRGLSTFGRKAPGSWTNIWHCKGSLAHAVGGSGFSPTLFPPPPQKKNESQP